MMHELQPIGSLVDGIKNTANLLSSIFSRKFGVVLLIVVLAGLASKAWL